MYLSKSKVTSVPTEAVQLKFLDTVVVPSPNTFLWKATLAFKVKVPEPLEEIAK